MKRSISCLFFLSGLMAFTPLYAATQTLTTYYPAPQGNYNKMTVNNALTIASQTAYNCTANNSSGVTLANVGGSLEVCDSTGKVWPYNVWYNPSGTTNIYPGGNITNVGIGITTPQSILDVNGTINFGSRQSSGGFQPGYLGNTWAGVTNLGYQFAYLGSSYFNGSNWITNSGANYGSNYVSEISLDAGPGIRFYTQPSTGDTQRTDSPTTFNGSSTTSGYERMRIDPNGNVGIGVTSPATKLHVVSGGGWGNEPIRAQSDSTFLSGADSGGNARFAINNNPNGTGGYNLSFFGNDGNWFNFMTVDNSGSRTVKFNGQTSSPGGNLGTNTVPLIQVCNSSGGNCGYLAVAQNSATCSGSTTTDCNYYAVYGP